MLSSNTTFRVYLSRVFNEECEVVNEPRQFLAVNLVLAKEYDKEPRKGYSQANGYFIDVDSLANELSIPDGYSLEVLLLSLANRKYGVKTLFPYETRVVAIKGIEGKIKERVEALRKIGIVSQSQSFLSGLGLQDIAEDLSLGYARFEKGDYDGAIKAYRKVVEGFRNYFAKKEVNGKKVYKILIDNSESRTEKIVDLLSKSYSLLSNFGEHHGTRAFYEEGIFANNLVEGLTEYLTKKLKRK